MKTHPGLCRIASSLCRLWRYWQQLCQQLSPLFDLGLRIYLFRVFFWSGWLKLAHWDGTLYLFRFEYHVPVLATAAELGLSAFLLAGLGTRLAAPGLFILNAVAMTSYPGLTPEGLKDHYLWASLLAMLWFHGAGRWAVSFHCRHGNPIRSVEHQ